MRCLLFFLVFFSVPALAGSECAQFSTGSKDHDSYGMSHQMGCIQEFKADNRQICSSSGEMSAACFAAAEANNAAALASALADCQNEKYTHVKNAAEVAQCIKIATAIYGG